MLRNSSILWTVVVTLIIAGSAGVVLSQQNQYKGFVLKSPVGENSAVRFFYDPALSDYFHSPVVFRAGEQGDARLVTPPTSTGGWTSYVSFSEMRELTQALAQSNLTWEETDRVEVLEPSFQIPRFEAMEILVVGSKGTARAKLRPTRICETLKPLDSVLKTQRAHWEFQWFRVTHGCQVPGFDWNLYPERN